MIKLGIGNLLNKLLIENKTNVRELSRQAGVPAQTIYSIIRRDNLKANLEDLYKLSQCLGVTLDYFCQEFMQIKKSPVPAEAVAEELKSDEQDLINNYRELNDDGKIAAHDSVEALTCLPKYKKSDNCKISENMDA